MVETGKPETALAAAVLLLGGALTVAGRFVAAGQDIPAAAGLTSMVGLGVTVFGVLVLLWWGSTFCLAVTAELLMRRGRGNSARRLGSFAPVFMRRTACLVLGMNLLAAPSAHAGAGLTFDHSAAEQVHSAADAPSLSPQWMPVEAQDVLEPSWRPSPLPSSGGLLVKGPREGRNSAEVSQGEVVVQPGDSLWTITERHLGPGASDAKVAEAWPRWYQANKKVIGEDPQLLQPGQILHPPTGTHSESKQSEEAR